MPHSPLPAAPYLIGFLLPPIVMYCAAAGGAWAWLPVPLLFAGVPALDGFMGMAETARQSPELDRNPYFKAVTWAWVPVQIGLIGWLLTHVTQPGLTLAEAAGAMVSTGAVTGALGITFAHELVHRSSRFDRALGEILLGSVCYTHFAIEHVHGHHRHVGTPRDPATARFGESFYRFLPRTLRGSLAGAWRLEIERLARRGKGRWSTSNRMLRYGLTQLVLFPLVWVWFEGVAVLAFALQAALAVSILEVINYIEHYGLVRREVADGEYERIAPQHSWDSSYRVTNWMLINLARHADHHCAASKRYQSLELLPAAPQLPAGYGAMFLLALVPPLWFRVMNPRAAAADPTKASIAP